MPYSDFFKLKQYFKNFNSRRECGSVIGYEHNLEGQKEELQPRQYSDKGNLGPKQEYESQNWPFLVFWNIKAEKGKCFLSCKILLL